MNVSSNSQRIHTGMRASVEGLKSVALLFLLVIGFSVAGAQAEETSPPAPLTKANQVQFETMLTSELQRVVDSQKRIKGQGKRIVVSARFDISTETLIIDLSEAYIPRNTKHISPELEEGLNEISNAAYDLMIGVVRFRDAIYRFSGKSLSDYFPNEISPAKAGKNKTAMQLYTVPTPAPVVVSPGHGYYYHYGTNPGWELQRPTLSNGIYEDLLTPDYATTLSSLLVDRSHETVTAIGHPRALGNQTIHTASGQAWWKMAGRYYLKEVMPTRTDIWGTLPNGNTDREELREYDEDIRSRPLFANDINASTIISLHTNGSTSTAANGTQVYYYTGDTISQALGNNVLCYMKELIHAQPNYSNYVVETQPRFGNHGENGLADMSAIIVEVGFHTNVSDAAALQNPEFRAAAMKGVEKGYRLNAAGKTTCEPFKISSIPSVTGPYRVSMPVLVNYVGYPQFPVNMKVDYVTCPYPWSCKGFEKSVATEVPSPLTYNVICNADPRPPATFKIKTTLTDADGVKTNAVEHTYTCATPAAAKQIIDTVPSGRPTTGAGKG